MNVWIAIIALLSAVPTQKSPGPGKNPQVTRTEAKAICLRLGAWVTYDARRNEFVCVTDERVEVKRLPARG